MESLLAFTNAIAHDLRDLPEGWEDGSETVAKRDRSDMGVVILKELRAEKDIGRWGQTGQSR